MKKNITLTVDPIVNGRDVYLSVKLHNYEDKAYYIRQNALKAMQCGAVFEVLSGPSVIECRIFCERKTVGSSNWLEVPAMSSVKEDNHISRFCDLEHATSGTYEMYFGTRIIFYTDHNHNYDYHNRFDIPVTLELE